MELGFVEDRNLNLKRIEITNFRHLNSINFDFGKVITVIAGGNGTGKTSLLGIIGHIFKYGDKPSSLFHERLETKYSDVFRFSNVHDISHVYHYKVLFGNGSYKNAELRITTESGRTRHRIDVGGRIAGGGKVKKPVIFLSLKRLLPLAQENERSIKFGIENLSAEQISEYSRIYNEIFSTQEVIVPLHTKSNNKNSFAPTTKKFDAHGMSAGQDNVGHIILALLSFAQLKNEDPNYSGGLLLIDELDATLYPAAQKNLLKVFLKKGQELDLQIVFTTHSSDLLNFLASRKASKFKHHTNFVSLSNALGPVTAKQGFSELNNLLAHLNHEVVRAIKPRKINFYFEDNEAYLFYKNIIKDIDLDCEHCYKNLSLSCGTYKSLIEKGFEEFHKSVVVLDGDSRAQLPENESNTIVYLPGYERPENVIKKFLENLPETDPFWDNSFQYTKKVFIDKINEVRDNRDEMKAWFKSDKEFWGDEASNLFNRWKQLNEEEANLVVMRTKEIVKRILDKFYELSTYA